MIFSFCALLIFITPMQLSASGITILQLNGRTELLIKASETAGIELKLAGDGVLTLVSKEREKKLRFSAGEKSESICLYQSLTGMNPDKIIIEGGEFDLQSAGIIAKKNDNSPPAADIGHIIFSDFQNTEKEPWKVYRWNLLPEILIFDTLDYKTQARLFKRLAFFVEKPGYIGRLVPNEELDGKHGWNAHDYKPDDLAEFFNTASETGFILNEEELYLRRLLLNHGIIIEKDQKPPYAAGKGAVLSVSRETEASWRYRFLTHECLHGIFFTDSIFRTEIYEVFAQLKPGETEFWKRLLDYRRYDVSNQYLLVNEFMAFCLQQPMNEVDEYFKGFLYRKMTAARPYEIEFVEIFDHKFPESFTSTVIKLEKILYNHTGRKAGHLANLFPEDVKDSFFNLFPPI